MCVCVCVCVCVQSTDVDPPFQKGALSPTKLAQLLHLPESEQALLRKTEEDFYSESLEVGMVCALCVCVCVCVPVGRPCYVRNKRIFTANADKWGLCTKCV